MATKPLDLTSHIMAVNNNSESTWVAGENAKFGLKPNHAQVQGLMGTIVDPDWTISSNTTTYQEPTLAANQTLPVNFDARVEWDKCESVIDNVRDQSNCGSCWAFGTTEAFNDRRCISSKSTTPSTTFMSTADTAGCCDGINCFSFDCNGGQVGTPWTWFTKTGVVSGGALGDTKDNLCYDYTMPDCNHHQLKSKLPECDAVKQVAPTCPAKTGNVCPTSNSVGYLQNKSKADTSYGFGRIDTVTKVKNDLQSYGSVTGAFTVYEDFLTYKSGVYQHQTGAALGGHAIKVIGWGTESGVDYWLCVNSWNRTWGDNGLFKIKQGDCGINNQMHAGHVGGYSGGAVFTS